MKLTFLYQKLLLVIMLCCCVSQGSLCYEERMQNIAPFEQNHIVSEPLFRSCLKRLSAHLICIDRSLRVKQNLCVANALSLCNVVTNLLTAGTIQTPTANITFFDPVNLTGSTAQIANLSGVQTINGAQFFLGIPGNTGITGITGNTGPNGQGATGIQGNPGPTGVFNQDNSFQVSKTTNQFFTTPSTTVNFDVVDFNNNWTLTNTTFTCPSSGLYRISFSATANSPLSPGYFITQITINGIPLFPQSQVSAAAENGGQTAKTGSGSLLAQLNQGDVLRVNITSFFGAGASLFGLPVVASLSAVKLE
ncbi:hypothetical protein Noda2021_07710 [Candidatus Dependentiae bacterium Noda2021]|nr:hypothetical protein Noda2021_07710 [Candidatus Dependentiae bacterium Noda2021]